MYKKQGIGWLISGAFEFFTGLIIHGFASGMRSGLGYYFDSDIRASADALKVFGWIFIIWGIGSLIHGLIIVITGDIEQDEETVYCRACHKSMPRHYSVCPHCGYQMRNVFSKKAAGTADKTKVKCIFCGNLVDENQPFCSQCGRKLEYNMSLQVMSQGKEEIKKTQKPVEKWKCAVCNFENLPWDNVCNKCGTKKED